MDENIEELAGGEYMAIMKRMAHGYDTEETQQIVEEVNGKTKKRVVKVTKHVPPNFQAVLYMINAGRDQEEDDTPEAPSWGEVEP